MTEFLSFKRDVEKVFGIERRAIDEYKTESKKHDWKIRVADLLSRAPRPFSLCVVSDSIELYDANGEMVVAVRRPCSSQALALWNAIEPINYGRMIGEII